MILKILIGLGILIVIGIISIGLMYILGRLISFIYKSKYKDNSFDECIIRGGFAWLIIVLIAIGLFICYELGFSIL